MKGVQAWWSPARWMIGVSRERMVGRTAAGGQVPALQADNVTIALGGRLVTASTGADKQ